MGRPTGTDPRACGSGGTGVFFLVWSVVLLVVLLVVVLVVLLVVGILLGLRVLHRILQCQVHSLLACL